MGIHIHQSAADHLVQMGAVPVKIDVDFRAVNVGYAALVVKILIVVSEIGFPEIGLRVIHDNLQFLFGGVVQQFLNFGNIFRGFVEDVLRQRPARRVIIDVVLFGAEILLVEMLVLHTAFPEGELRAVVELGAT